jgi:hypothetical protein
MKLVLILLAIYASAVSATEFQVKKQVKVFDGKKVNKCLEEKGRFRERYGAWRLQVTNIQAILKDGIEYLQVFGEFKYFRCKYITHNGKEYGYLSNRDLSAVHTFDQISYDNPSEWYKIQIHADQAEILVDQDGVYKVIGKTALQLNKRQSVHIEIPVSGLNFSLSETAPPVFKSNIDFSMRAHFLFNSQGRKEQKQWVDFGDFRLHFTANKLQATSDLEKRWEFILN